MTEALIVDNVSKNFSGHQALSAVNMTVHPGNIYGLLGPNGAGKTTLMRIINQILAPDEGLVFINGKKLSHNHIAAIGYLPEERGLYKKMRVREQVIYLSRLKGLDKQKAAERLDFLFEKFAISAWSNHKVSELSKGMQQKIQFITTILHEPEILILDEPFSGFDPVNMRILKNEILELKKKGKTILLSTHDMASVEELCERITLIDDSKTILDGRIEKIKEDYKQNIFEIRFKGGDYEKIKTGIGKMCEIINYESDRQGEKILVKINEQTDSNVLVKEIIKYADIIGLREILPGINDIFVRLVGEKKESNE